MLAGPRQGREQVTLYRTATINATEFRCKKSGQTTHAKVDRSVFMIRNSHPEMPNLADKIYIGRALHFLEHTPPNSTQAFSKPQSLMLGEWFRPKDLSGAGTGCPVVSGQPYSPAEGRLWSANAIVPTNLSLMPMPASTATGIDMNSQCVLHVDSDFMTKDYGGLGG